MPLCFAYGSNMDRGAMAQRCPGATVVAPARLERHRLALMREGYLTVLRDPRRSVHGLLWQVPLADMTALDRYEGLAEGLYVKRRQPVVTSSGARTALVYIGRNTGPGQAQPGYLDAVLAAARDAGLPSETIRELQALGGTRRPDTPSPPVASKPVAGVRPTRATPFDAPRENARKRWVWTP